MAGSITNRQYITDSGVRYSIRVDKSNANGNIGGDARSLCGLREGNYPALPAGFGKRYLLAFLKSNPLVKRKFFVGNADVLRVALLPGSTISASPYAATDGGPGPEEEFVITAYRGERQRVEADYLAGDTGLDDGSVIQ